MESFTTATNSARNAMRVGKYAVIPHGIRCATRWDAIVDKSILQEALYDCDGHVRVRNW